MMAAPTRHVREAVRSDATGIGEAWASAWGVAYVDFFPSEVLAEQVAWRRTQTHRLFDQPNFEDTTLFVVESDLMIEGFAHVGHATEDSDGEVYGFYLHPKCWGTGAATTLMDAARQEMIDRGFDLVRVWTHRDALRAHGFYTKAGYRKSGREKEGDLVPGVPVPEVEFVWHHTA